jgi:transcription-repair coupling factor (superfamily II helicase)
VNLILNKPVVTELIQKEMNSSNLHTELKNILNPEIRQRILNDFHVIEFGARCLMQPDKTIEFQAQPQLSFNKNFDMLITKLNENSVNNIDNFIFTVDLKQAERLHTILDDIQSKNETSRRTQYYTIARPIHEGFTDFTCRVACFTDHQIFDRYHLFHIRKATYGREALSVKELYNLQPGDFVTHIDHGVGRFDGLETIENNGRQQEAIRLVYQDGDLLYLSIHSLHRIAKFIGKEGIAPILCKCLAVLLLLRCKNRVS